MNAAVGASVYESPPEELVDTEFIIRHYYHVTDLPDGTITPGMWDLRGAVDDYLGNVDLRGRRVLEIGPASGFLTMEMEKRGAEVVALEIPDDVTWDFVPFSPSIIPNLLETRADLSRRLSVLKQTFWHTHKVFNLKAKAVYARPSELPNELGLFDMVVLAAVLLHTRNPHEILAACAKSTNTIVIAEPFYSSLEQLGPVIRLHPSKANKDWSTWWHFSTGWFKQYLELLGFGRQQLTFSEQLGAYESRMCKFFTIVASR